MMMKFTLKADVVFEADTPDEAMIKLAMHFMMMMVDKPVLQVQVNSMPYNLKVLDIMSKRVESLDNSKPEGGMIVSINGIHEEPRMMQ
jgi:hypothetical protein